MNWKKQNSYFALNEIHVLPGLLQRRCWRPTSTNVCGSDPQIITTLLKCRSTGSRQQLHAGYRPIHPPYLMYTPQLRHDLIQSNGSSVKRVWKDIVGGKVLSCDSTTCAHASWPLWRQRCRPLVAIQTNSYRGLVKKSSQRHKLRTHNHTHILKYMFQIIYSFQLLKRGWRVFEEKHDQSHREKSGSELVWGLQAIINYIIFNFCRLYKT